MRLYTLGQVDDDAITAQSTALKKDKQGVEAEIATLQQRLQHYQDLQDQYSALKAYTENVTAHIEHFGFEDKRLAVEALQIRVTLQPDRKVDVVGLLPTQPSAMLVDHGRRSCYTGDVKWRDR